MAGLFPEELLSRIRASSDIVDIIGAALPLKRAGANFVTLCPFHKEKSPSFNVNPQKQIFHCFGCHKGGDVFTFVKEYENITFMEAVRRLAQRAHIPIETEQNPAAEKARFVKEALLQIHEQITARWQSALQNEASGQIARDYLAKRGVTEEAVKLFRLGYAPEAWDDTVNWARAHGHEPALVEQAGLIIAREQGGHYDRFRGRLMFPICDEQGRVVGFSGRILSGDEKTAKYVNSPETPIFTKGRVMFGLDKSKRAILDAGFAIICEGQLDLIACFMAGVRNIVAPQGTALTADHARVLKRYVDEVVLCFDSDSAGQNAAVRALDDLLTSGLAIRVATVPAPHDPDSFIKAHGGEAFKRLIQSADGFFDYYLRRLCALNDPATDRGRQAVVRAMGVAVLKTGNAVLIDTHAQKTAQRLGVAVDSVRAEFRRTRSAPMPAPRGAAEETMPVEPEPLAKPTAPEGWLLRLVLQHDDLVEWTAAHLDPGWVSHPVVRRVVEQRLAAVHGGEWTGVAALLGSLDDAERSLVTEAVSDRRPVTNPGEVMMGVYRSDGLMLQPGLIHTLRDAYLDRCAEDLTRRIQDPAVSDAEKVECVHRMLALRNAKKAPLSPRSEDSG